VSYEEFPSGFSGLELTVEQSIPVSVRNSGSASYESLTAVLADLEQVSLLANFTSNYAPGSFVLSRVYSYTLLESYDEVWSSPRPISIGQLNITALTPPTYQPGSLPGVLSVKLWEIYLVGGFALRCFQRLSRPYLATQLCRWQNNWYTRGMSIPVLSY
jgi:hypothetical protein